jgi:hypothetical protein
MVTAITSSSSIAGWAIWNNYPVIWGGILAASQVINTIKNYIPYSQRITLLESLFNALEGLFNNIEKEWLYIQNGTYDEFKVNELIFGFKSKQTKYYTNIIPISQIPEYKNLIEKSNNELKQYLTNTYGEYYEK